MAYSWIEINQEAFNHNCAYYKNLIGKNNKLAAVIKGNGYGHGIEHIALLCEQSKNIDWICVAQLSEALLLKDISKPILVLGYSDMDPELVVGKTNIYFMVDHLEYAQLLNEIGKRNSYYFNIHIKVDTGLSRMGVLPQDAVVFIQAIQKLHYLKINGIYSHFAASDSNQEFTAIQLQEFNTILEQLKPKHIVIENIHMRNSAAISTVQYPDSFNFFRVGLGLYGLGLEKDHLKSVMTWKTKIAHIKTVPAYSFIGYANTYQTKRETRIALLPIGYYDGYKFRFSNKTSVVINNQSAPVIGRVAMNITMVDVTDIEANTGDEVILVGADEAVHPDTLTQKAEIKNVREILTGINSSIIREIIEN